MKDDLVLFVLAVAVILGTAVLALLAGHPHVDVVCEDNGVIGERSVQSIGNHQRNTTLVVDNKDPDGCALTFGGDDGE